MDNLSVFVERLKEYMEEHGLNTSTLASEIKFCRATVSGLLHEAHVPSTKIIIALVEYFNCSKITEYRLQQDLEISSSLTYRWLQNISLPKVDTLIKLKKYFGCSIDYLLGREN